VSLVRKKTFYLKFMITLPDGWKGATQQNVHAGLKNLKNLLEHQFNQSYQKKYVYPMEFAPKVRLISTHKRLLSTHESKFHTYVGEFDTHECDSNTQSVISTRTSVILTRNSWFLYAE
jgi:hypothetical protein